MDQATVRAVATRAETPAVRLIIAADRAIYRVAHRWLAVVNAVFAAQVVSVLLAPALVAWGKPGLARPIYAVNGLFCHQKDERSFAVFGEKMACCERCAAIYGAVLLFGLLFTLLRARIGRPRLTDLALLAMPVLIDGGAQALGVWESSAATRVLSGALLGVAIGWFLLPYLESGFGRIRRQLETLFARLVAEGRTRPL